MMETVNLNKYDKIILKMEDNGRIVIPKYIREDQGLKGGDLVEGFIIKMEEHPRKGVISRRTKPQATGGNHK